MRPNDYMISVYRGSVRSPVTGEDVERAVVALWDAEFGENAETARRYVPEGSSSGEIFFSILAAIERDSEGKRRPKSGYGRPEDIVAQAGWPDTGIYLSDYATGEHYPSDPYYYDDVAEAINELIAEFLKNESQPNIWGMPQRFAVVAEKYLAGGGIVETLSDMMIEVGVWPVHTDARNFFDEDYQFHNALGFQ